MPLGWLRGRRAQCHGRGEGRLLGQRRLLDVAHDRQGALDRGRIKANTREELGPTARRVYSPNRAHLAPKASTHTVGISVASNVRWIARTVACLDNTCPVPSGKSGSGYAHMRACACVFFGNIWLADTSAEGCQGAEGVKGPLHKSQP